MSHDGKSSVGKYPYENFQHTQNGPSADASLVDNLALEESICKISDCV